MGIKWENTEAVFCWQWFSGQRLIWTTKWFSKWASIQPKRASFINCIRYTLLVSNIVREYSCIQPANPWFLFPFSPFLFGLYTLWTLCNILIADIFTINFLISVRRFTHIFTTVSATIITFFTFSITANTNIVKFLYLPNWNNSN